MEDVQAILPHHIRLDPLAAPGFRNRPLPHEPRVSALTMAYPLLVQ